VAASQIFKTTNTVQNKEIVKMFPNKTWTVN